MNRLSRGKVSPHLVAPAVAAAVAAVFRYGLVISLVWWVGAALTAAMGIGWGGEGVAARGDGPHATRSSHQGLFLRDKTIRARRQTAVRGQGVTAALR